MKVLTYKYIAPNEQGIVEALDRSAYMTPQYINMVEDYLASVQLTGKAAFLYVGGVTLSASEARVVSDKGCYRESVHPSGVQIKELSAYHMHKWISRINGKENIDYANINSNTCASSMYSLYEAQELFAKGFDEVIIVAEEKTSYNTLRVFDEHGIELKVGEGLAIMHLSKDGSDITDCKWSFEYNRNPFGTTTSGYLSVDTDSVLIKPHGTGTDNNESAEQELCMDRPQLRYKEQIGHTQGVSGLLEICMALDDPNVYADTLCVSAGLGGFYGSCILHPRK